MQPFTLKLDDGGVTSGRLSIPVKRSSDKFIPLIICLHGGGYDAEYFDSDSEHSIAGVSDALGIPVISVTRPGYGDSTMPFAKEDTDDCCETYSEKQGNYLNSTVFPAIWRKYGTLAGATAVVVLAHSIGAMIAVIAAGSHNGTEGYPFSALITSGIGSEHVSASRGEILKLLSAKTEFVNFDPTLKDILMLELPHKNITNPKMSEHTARLNKPIPFGEVQDINGIWIQSWQKYCRAVKVPVMHGLSEFDSLWLSTPAAMQSYQMAFISSRKTEVVFVPMAPHCIELSLQNRAWFTRCCGFAIESVVLEGLSKGS